jgi:hypothetical protein
VTAGCLENAPCQSAVTRESSADSNAQQTHLRMRRIGVQMPKADRDDSYHALRQVVEREMAPVLGTADGARCLEDHVSRGKSELAGVVAQLMPRFSGHFEVRWRTHITCM